MYNEKKFKITIFFTRLRRYLFIFFLVILGLVGAYFLSEVLTEIFRMPQKITTIIMVATGVTIFCISFILTSDLEFKIQEAYLEMKTLKKLNLVSFKLDKLLENAGISISDEITKELQTISNTKAMAKTKKKKFMKFKKDKNAVLETTK